MCPRAVPVALTRVPASAPARASSSSATPVGCGPVNAARACVVTGCAGCGDEAGALDALGTMRDASNLSPTLCGSLSALAIGLARGLCAPRTRCLYASWCRYFSILLCAINNTLLVTRILSILRTLPCPRRPHATDTMQAAAILYTFPCDRPFMYVDATAVILRAFQVMYATSLPPPQTISIAAARAWYSGHVLGLLSTG